MLLISPINFVDEFILLALVTFVFFLVKHTRVTKLKRRRQDKISYEINKRRDVHTTS